MVLGAAWQALAHDGIARWLVFTLGAPGGLACAALGMGGAERGLVAIALVGAACAALHLLAVRRSDVPIASDDAQEGSILVSLPERFGALIASMERWVVGAVATAVAAGAALAAWMVATADRHVVSTPGDRVASSVARAGRRVQPLVGMPLGRVVWAILAALAVLLACSVARAAPGTHPSGRIVLSLPGGVQGPLELAPGQGGWVGTMTVTNVGSRAAHRLARRHPGRRGRRALACARGRALRGRALRRARRSRPALRRTSSSRGCPTGTRASGRRSATSS